MPNVFTLTWGTTGSSGSSCPLLTSGSCYSRDSQLFVKKWSVTTPLYIFLQEYNMLRHKRILDTADFLLIFEKVYQQRCIVLVIE